MPVTTAAVPRAAELPSTYLYAIGGQDAPGRFTAPTRIDAAPGGEVLVADAASHRVQAFGAGGDLLWAIGAAGDAQARFCVPAGLAVATDASLYVADSCLGRLQVFDGMGRFLSAWDRYAEPGRPGTRFLLPTDVASGPDGSLLVADGLDSRVLRFDRDGALLDSWGGSGSGPGRFARVTGLDVSTDGETYVVDGASGRVQVFDLDGNLIGGWDVGPAEDVAVSADAVVVVGGSAFGVSWYDRAGVPQGHVPLGTDLAPGTRGLSNAASVSVAADGSVYVLDVDGPAGAARLIRLTGSGSFVSAAEGGTASAGAIDPAAVALDLAGAVYVADERNNRVQVFTPDGMSRSVWLGEAAGGIESPSGVAVYADGSVYVSESARRRVLKLSPDGAVRAVLGGGAGQALGQFGASGPASLSCIHPAASTPQLVYAIDPSNTRAQAFGLDGAARFAFGSVGTGDGQFGEGAIGDVATAASGDVYVTDAASAQQRVQVFDYGGAFRFAFNGQVGEDSRLVPLRGIAVGPGGRVFASDPRSRIQVFSANGEFVDQWDTYASRPDMVIAPGDLGVGANGRLYLADRQYGFVHVFGPSRDDAWRIGFYANPWVAGELAQVEWQPDLEFEWGSDAPATGVPADGFSLRASRFVTLPAGEVRVSVAVDGGVRVWLDDRLLVDEWPPRHTQYLAAAEVAAGEHLLQVEYVDDGGNAELVLRYGDEVPTLTPSATLAVTGTPTATRTPRPTRPPPTSTGTATATATASAAPTARPTTEVSRNWLPFAEAFRR